MLNKYGLQDPKPVVTPAVSRDDDDDEAEEDASAEEHRTLRRIVGKCQFLAPRRPDIAFATNRLARSVAKPSKSDIIASKRLLRYLRGTMDLGLKMQVRNRVCTTLTVFADSDWAGDRPMRKSVSSWVIMLDGFLLSAGARTQSVVAQSSCEAEYIAATAATSEAEYIAATAALFSACAQHVDIDLRSDSSGAIGVASKRFATSTASGRAILVAAARNSSQEGPNQRSALTRERGRRQQDRRSLEFCRTNMGVTEIPKHLRDTVL